jgi:hypothetical protein
VKRIQKNNIILLLSAVILAAGGLSEKSFARPDPGTALWKSMIVPGWGHYYVDSDNWTRGKYHLASDAILIISYFGFDARSSNLQSQSFTLANLRAGIDLQERSRAFRLAVGDFSDLQSYNDHQLRTRNWHRLIDDVPENRWNWAAESDRREYRDLRQTSDRTRQQLPAIISLLVVNRVLSGLSAFVRARDMPNPPEARVEPVRDMHGTGYTATISFRF